jgi:hypothetical protein
MKTIKVMLALLFSSSMAFSQSNTAVLDAYLKVKNDLVQSDSKHAETHITEFQKVIITSDISNKDALNKAVQKIAKTSDLDKQRKGFDEVSILLWTIIKKDTAFSNPIYYQYCPMKKAYWISNEATIKNPYYGSSMLTCGKIVELNKSK